MALDEDARLRLAGMWGSHDSCLIRDLHFVTESELVDRFLHHYQPLWNRSEIPLDRELSRSVVQIRELLSEWAPAKVRRILENEQDTVIHENIMFKQLHFGPRKTLNFGSVGVNWKGKSQIAEELSMYRPWTVRHAAQHFGGTNTLLDAFREMVNSSASPTEVAFFEGWWELSTSLDRPMLFPQVSGHSAGKLWMDKGHGSFPVRFDFGFINCEKRSKILIECDSRKYHSKDRAYQNDRTRQNLAEGNGWSVRRFTYDDVITRLSHCFDNLSPGIDPYD